jgi:tRNA nucleotidyltransferase (CCA-adding enzyme)
MQLMETTDEKRHVEIGSPTHRRQEATSGMRTSDGSIVLEGVRRLPGGIELLDVASEHDGKVELVGGAVRDIMLGSPPRELDVIVDSGVEQLASALASKLGGEATLYERFGTAVVHGAHVSIDLATIRAESYPKPGALPEVHPGTPEQDLERRDFTVNAIALELAGERPGQVRAVASALEDLDARRLRVLHDASFLDDPTRIWRLVRYATRLGFEVEPHTAALAAAALSTDALKTVSGPRLGGELRLAFTERDPVSPLAELDRLGVLAAWEPGVSFDEHVVRTALEILPEDGSVQVLLAASLLLELCNHLDKEETEPTMRGFLHDLELPAGEGDRAFGAAVSASFASDHVHCTDTTVDLLELTIGTPVEALALAGAVREMEDGPGSYGRRVVEEWLSQQRHVSLEVTGDDLIAAGVPEGPEVGVRLEESYRLLLEERIEPGRDTELRAALEARV